MTQTVFPDIGAPRSGWLGGSGPRVAVAVAYVALSLTLEWLSHVRPSFAIGITPWSPQAGLAIALLLSYGWRWTPLTVLAIAAGEILVRHAPLTSPMTYLGSMWIGCAYATTAEIVHRSGLPVGFTTAVEAARLAAVLLTGVLVAAGGYVAVYVIAGELPAGDAYGAFARLWVGELNGVLAITPLLLNRSGGNSPGLAIRRHSTELAAPLLIVALTLGIVFMLPAANQLRFFYLLFLPIIWIALRWEWRGALLAVLVIQAGLLVVAEARIPTAHFIDLQFLMLTLTLTALLLGAVVEERAEIFRRMAAREAEQRTLLAMAPDAVLVTDARWRIRVANAAATRLFGEQVAIIDDLALDKLIPGFGHGPVEERALIAGRRPDGTEFPAEVAWARLEGSGERGFLVIVRDVTERRRAEEQLRTRDAALAGAMRFAAVGELSSGLAHELNQPITALVSYLRACQILANSDPQDGTRLAATLDKSVREAIRASDMLHRLRDFYQGAAPKCEPVHLPTLCRSVASAFEERLRRADASLELDVDPAIPALAADSTQIEMVLHNLLGNAVDAVVRPGAQARRIRLRVACDSDAVRLLVEDSGPGVADEIRGRLFDPFVTNKADGMGLGLAISRSLVQSRGGELSFSPNSSLGGAAFAIVLPIRFSHEASDG